MDVVTGIGGFRCCSLPPAPGTVDTAFRSNGVGVLNPFVCAIFPPHDGVVGGGAPDDAGAVPKELGAPAFAGPVAGIVDGVITPTALISLVILAACERRGIEPLTDAPKPEPAPNMTSPLAESGDPSRPTEATAAAACTATTAASLLRLITSSGPSTAVGSSEIMSV